ncbi:hypothetical protein L6164_013827 [Bauhinia variegata]|uniref:Uncharacterized protein n=1 Tax=Bauhinia variegata TaxID=167791 RepID=A0ACB9NFF5_BAUVA|nr:hypothetical protein L6164_013827 [Bauhinia variegata]
MAEQIQTEAHVVGSNEQVRQEHQLVVGISQSSTSATAHTTAGSKISNPKARSIVWDHFTKLSIEQTNGEEKAKCHHCKSEFLCNSTSHGTNGMLKHLKRCHKWIFVKKNQSLIEVTEGEEGEGGRKITVSISYNTEEIRKLLVIFVIEDEMSFSVVEGRGFRYFVNRLEPRFKVPSKRTITRDCYQLFLDEKSRLKEFLKKSCVEFHLHYVEHAIPFQKAFERLEDEDEGYVTWFKDDRQPSSLDWDNARAFIQFLKLFYEVTLALSGSLHVTTNCAFDEIQTINELLVKWSENEADYVLGTMACNMRNKFDKYWGKIENINPLIYIGIVLDPRYKLEYVNFICDANYEIGTATLLKKKIANTLWQLYNFYAQESHDVSQTSDDSASYEESVITKEGLANMG